MQIFNNNVIDYFSQLEKIRNNLIKYFDTELENLMKLPEEERIDNMNKIRKLLRLRELYKNLDVKLVKDEMIFFNGKAVITNSQLEEINKMHLECVKELEEYKELIDFEEFVLTSKEYEKIKQYISDREQLLQMYVATQIMMSRLKENKRLKNDELDEASKLLSETYVTIENGKVYLNGNLIKTNKDFFSLLERIAKINEKTEKAMEELKGVI